MTRRKYIVKLTHVSHGSYYVGPRCVAVTELADAARFPKRRDAEAMGAQICNAAAFRGDESWSYTVEVEVAS